MLTCHLPSHVSFVTKRTQLHEKHFKEAPMSPYEEESGTISEDVSLPVVKVTDETPSQVDEVGNMLCIPLRTS